MRSNPARGLLIQVLQNLVLLEEKVVEQVPLLPPLVHLFHVKLGLLLGQLLLVVLAVFAFAKVRARNPRDETLAVLFAAVGFLAVAASNVDGLLVALLLDVAFVLAAEGVGVLLLCLLDDQVSDVFELLLVVAVHAAAVGRAEPAVAETLAVELQALRLFAVAPALGLSTFCLRVKTSEIGFFRNIAFE